MLGKIPFSTEGMSHSPPGARDPQPADEVKYVCDIYIYIYIYIMCVFIYIYIHIHDATSYTTILYYVKRCYTV